jgi:hypothetical protein
LLRFASQGPLRDESAERRAVSRTTLRRAVPSFTVEVRRRPKRATPSKPDAPSSETKSPRTGLDRASHRPLAAASEAEKPDPSLVEVASSPKGRILPSLVPDDSLRRTLQDATLTAAESDPPSRAPKRPPVRTSKGKDQKSKLLRNKGMSSGDSAPLAERLSTTSRQTASVQSNDGAGVSPRDPTTAPRKVAGDSGGLVLSAKAKPRSMIAILHDDLTAKLLPNGQRSAIGTDAPATPSSLVDDRLPPKRKRTIMARYVFGDELKPGERWKRRLLTLR